MLEILFMKGFTIALATCEKEPELHSDDQLTLPAFKAAGIEAVPVIWSSQTDWQHFDAVIVRSTWDYWLHYSEFLAWIDRLERDGVALWNSPAALRWNTNKIYLRELESRGVPTIPTEWMSPQNRRPVAEILAKRNWNEAVLKPALSAGAYRTHRVSRNSAHSAEPLLDEILTDATAMIQPLVPEILSQGELSFLFHGGRFSHAVIKRGVPGEFRIQRTFGGVTTPQAVSKEWIDQAGRVLDRAGYDFLYARVDMVESAGRLLLMELEVTEPSLFFEHDARAPARFAEAVLHRLKSRLEVGK